MSSAKALLSWGKKVALSLWQRNTRPICKHGQLRGEELESRCMPATYLWDPGSNLNWNTQDNWLRLNAAGEWVPTNAIPGAMDHARFHDTNKSCIVDAPAAPGAPITVLSIQIGFDYSGTISIQGAGLKVTGSSADSITSHMDSSLAKISGGTLSLANDSLFTWRAGMLFGTQVKVGGGANTAARMHINNATGGFRGMVGTTLDVAGRLKWEAGDVFTIPTSLTASQIRVSSTGVFEITAAGVSFGRRYGLGDNPNLLSIDNAGLVLSKSTGTAKLVANYKSTKITRLEGGTLELTGTAEQTGASSSFEILGGSTAKVSNGLSIREGQLIGYGTVESNLGFGYDPNLTGYNPQTHGLALPVLAPGGGTTTDGTKAYFAIGTITVTGSLHVFSGLISVEIGGPNIHDLIAVGGEYVSFATTVAAAAVSSRKLEGKLLAVRDLIPANTEFPFLTYNQLISDFGAPPPTDPVTYPAAGWTVGRNNSQYWFKSPNAQINAAQGRIGGRLFRDDGAVAGAFEAGVEGAMVGVTVRLRDATGANVLATTTSDANGLYEFANRGPGTYVVEFDLPNNERFTTPHAAADTIDSDADPTTGRFTVHLDVDPDVDDVFAGYVANADPVAVNDAFDAHKNTGIAGTVVANDTDSDGDTFAVTLDTDVSHGTLVLNSDGTFTYTPDTNYTGTDSFVYEIDDGYGGTDTATATITIASTPAPVGANDTYTTPAGLTVDAASGVLDNDTDQNNGTLVALLVIGPTHGSLTLNADGSFSYLPDDDFVGNDTFAYRPTDDDGPGNLTTVTITVTDTPPEAADDSAGTDEDEAVEIDVLANDTDEDEDDLTILGASDGLDEDDLTILGASDGLFGTVAIDDNGTASDPTDDLLVYTPQANWNGTDWFVYVIDDGHGRLAYGVVTVTVDPVNDTPDAVNDTRTVLFDTASAFDVRGNDTDIDGDTLTITQVTQGSHGTVTITGGGTGVTYTPDTGYLGTDSFTYTISDGHGGTDTATVSITVSPYVRITAFSNPLVEGEGGADVFSIQRFGDVSQSLTVYLTFTVLSGYAFATPGVDFVPNAQSGGSVGSITGSGTSYTMAVTFDAESSSVALDFAPIEDWTEEGMEGVLLTLSSVPSGWVAHPDFDDWGLLIEDGEGGA